MEITRRVKRKHEKQRMENALLRNIFSSIVLESKINWARYDRLRDIMCCVEEEPGVPEEEIL